MLFYYEAAIISFAAPDVTVILFHVEEYLELNSEDDFDYEEVLYVAL